MAEEKQDETEVRVRIIEVSRELTTTPEVLQRMYDERRKTRIDTNLLNLLSVWNEVPWLIEIWRKEREDNKKMFDFLERLKAYSREKDGTLTFNNYLLLDDQLEKDILQYLKDREEGEG